MMAYTSKLKGILRPVPQMELSEPCSQAEALMFRYPDAGCIAVVDRVGRPAGIIVYNRFFHLLTASRNMGYLLRQPVQNMMSAPSLVADLHAEPEEVLQHAENRHKILRRDPVLVMEGERIAGALQISDLELLQPAPAPARDREQAAGLSR
ncbi:hypothetical protein [Paenibacillus sp. YN15]|uniref:CBS domain-containing protein n=1 Tax=Paenibacillus sp. YN15 TaxID=1742774 RepID=UPI000DCBA402|nr:hypothetical protein [Paenibacillus sp. YN15]RAV06591.1 hypothetical protein DQG13_01825 [Paenibacillus sp. YN15]